MPQGVLLSMQEASHDMLFAMELSDLVDKAAYLTDPIGAVACSRRVSFAMASSNFSLPKSGTTNHTLCVNRVIIIGIVNSSDLEQPCNNANVSTDYVIRSIHETADHVGLRQ